MAQVWEYIKIAIMNIRSNKGRSILTMLGIIIGISSVIMIISIGNGVKSQVNGELNDIAGGQIYISADNSNKENAEIYFNNDDIEYLAENVDHIKGITPAFSMYGTATGKKGSVDGLIGAGTVGQQFVSPNPIVYGRYFSESDYYSAKKVCVISESNARTLFGTTNVVGMEIEVNISGISQELRIVGVRQDSAASLINMTDTGRLSMDIPITVLGNSYGFFVDKYTDLLIISESAEYATEVAKAAVNLMESRYDAKGKGQILIQNFNDVMGQINSVLDYITIFVVFVAAISLLVGGIGVMNIMLVSVTERTREIGIRKALGARTHSIMLQFLSESAIITLLGGFIGITFGIIGAVGICSIIGFEAKVTLGTIIGASLFSSGVGLFFGIYPAKKAAKLSPIEALRHE